MPLSPPYVSENFTEHNCDSFRKILENTAENLNTFAERGLRGLNAGLFVGIAAAEPPVPL